MEKEKKIEEVIQEMIESGELACFIGQVIKLHWTRKRFTVLHFENMGYSNGENALSEALGYAAKLPPA